jgi:NitT/TauT family transport system permease protein
LLAWEFTANILSIPPYLLPSLTKVISRISENSAALMSDAIITLLEALGGVLFASMLAITLGVLSVYFSSTERFVMPYVVAMQAVPIVAIAPLLIIWFGNGYAGKVILAGLVSFFPLSVNVITGLRKTPIEILDLLRMLGASRTQILWTARLPFAMPYLTAGLRIGCGLSVIGAIVAELAGSDRGIGFQILMSSYRTDTPMLFSAIIVSCLISMSLYLAAKGLERTVEKRFSKSVIQDNA